MVQFDRINFGKMSKTEKKKFIDELLEKGIRLNKDETVAATREQKKRYINSLISQVKELERHEIEAATDKQMKMYINKKRWLSIAEYGQLPKKFKKMYIDMALSKKTGLTNEEFENTPKELKQYYCEKTMDFGYEMGPMMFAHMKADDQKKYVDLVLAAGHKLTMEYELYMKSGVKAYYDREVKNHPYLWESKLRKQIRGILLDSL
jgi:polyhydroxyalkanoate synthesis regulator phasin